MTHHIKLRPAQPHDKTAITALAAKIWDGEDYLHHNFDAWLAQERGRFTVAYAGEELVGCGKLTEFRPGEWWLEGLRVDPAWRGNGIARLLHENAMQIVDEIAAAENLAGNIRLATSSENDAVHKLALDTGFTHTTSHLLFKANVTPTNEKPSTESQQAVQIPPTLPFTPISLYDNIHLLDWLNQSAYFAASHGLFEDTWKWYEIRPRLDQLIQNGRLFWWRKTKNGSNPTKDLIAGGLVIVHHRDPQTMVLNYLDTPTGRWADLLEDVRLLAQTYNVTQIKCKPLATSQIRLALSKTTWEIDYDLEMWVFQRPIG